MNRSEDVLAARYRRILTLLPAGYRERRGEEMLGTLLDGAARGERWPGLGEVASLAALALRLRVGAPGGSRRAVAAGEVLRRTALAGLLTFGLWHAGAGIADLVVMVSTRGRFIWHEAGYELFRWVALDYGQPLIYFGAFVALVLGRRRLGRFLAVAQTAPLAAMLILDRWTTLSDRAALLGVALLIAVTAALGFHREAPRLAAPGRWLAVMVAFTGPVLIVSGMAAAADLHGDPNQPRVIDTIARVAAGPLLPALAAVFGLVRARKSPVWPAALLLLGLPALLLLPRTIVIGMQGKSGRLFAGDLFGATMWPGMALDMLIADTALAAALCWALYRYRRRTRSNAATA